MMVSEIQLRSVVRKLILKKVTEKYTQSFHRRPLFISQLSKLAILLHKGSFTIPLSFVWDYSAMESNPGRLHAFDPR